MDRVRSIRIALVAVPLALAACSVFTSLDGLSGGDVGGGDAASADSGGRADAAGNAVNDGAVDSVDGHVDPCGAPSTDPDLVGYYRFEEGVGTTVKDCSGHGHDGVIIDSPAAGSWVAGHPGSGIRLDGHAGCIELGAGKDFLLATRAFTVTAWVNIADFAGPDGNGYLIGKTRNPNVAGWRFATEAPQTMQLKAVRAADAGALQVDATNLPASTWIHVAALFVPGANADVYVNGQRVGTGAASASIVEDNASTLRIGCRSDDGFRFSGVIDEVRIYTRALAATELAALALAP